MDRRILNVLATCPLFATMSELELDLTLSSVSHRVVDYAKRDVYALAGMPCRYADIMLTGELVCRMSSLSGKQVEVSRLRPGNLVAPAFVFAKDRSLPVSVETEVPTSVFRLRPETLQELIDTNATIRMNFIRVLSQIDVFLTHRMKVLSLFTVREKVASMLLEQAGKQNSNVIQLDQSRQVIADSFGIQKYSLLRVLSEMQDNGAIHIKGKQIEILDRSLL